MTDPLATFTHIYRYGPVDRSTGGIDVPHTLGSFVGRLKITTPIKDAREAEDAFENAMAKWLQTDKIGMQLHAMMRQGCPFDFRDYYDAGLFKSEAFISELAGVHIRIDSVNVFEISSVEPAGNDDPCPVTEVTFARLNNLMISPLHDF